jgi:hypothetical protein
MYWQSLWLRAPRLVRHLRGSFIDLVTEEIPMATALKDVRQRAAAMREERARDAAQAVRDYEADKLAVRANTARLRALRLAKEAANAHDTQTPRPAKTIPPCQTGRRVSTPGLE